MTAKFGCRASIGPVGLIALLLTGCTREAPPCACDEVPLPESQIVDVEGFSALLDVARPVFYPDLAGVPVAVETLADVQYFQATVDLATLADPPRERQYLVQVDPVVFDDPPNNDAFRGLIAHELGHVQDYVGMDTDALVSFALWYAGGDVADYERATDVKALQRGCATGLVAYWDWLYAHVDGELLATKQQNYLMPDEIASWQDTNTCDPWPAE